MNQENKIFMNAQPVYNDATLQKLCKQVATGNTPWEDCAEEIENCAYYVCEHGGFDNAVAHIETIIVFFEQLENKNEEHIRDLSDLFILIGELHQCAGFFAQSIPWFIKASVVHDRLPTPFHCMAISYIQLRDLDKAISCLEQEIAVAPGNYFSYLKLADIYEQAGYLHKKEECLKSLLFRDETNMMALHKLIVFYEQRQPQSDVQFLRRRLIGIQKEYSRIELQIMIFHLCQDKRFNDALSVLNHTIPGKCGDGIVHLLRAHLYGLLHNFSHKRKELKEYLRLNNGREGCVHNELAEFADIFGQKASEKLGKRLNLLNPGN